MLLLLTACSAGAEKSIVPATISLSPSLISSSPAPIVTKPRTESQTSSVPEHASIEASDNAAALMAQHDASLTQKVILAVKRDDQRKAGIDELARATSQYMQHHDNLVPLAVDDGDIQLLITLTGYLSGASVAPPVGEHYCYWSSSDFTHAYFGTWLELDDKVYIKGTRDEIADDNWFTSLLSDPTVAPFFKKGRHCPSIAGYEDSRAALGY